MDSHSTQLSPTCSSTAPAATACHQWMLLAPYGGGIGEACNITGDTKTIAAGVTSNGQRIVVSLRREPSPAMSRICLGFLPGTDKYNRQSAHSTVIAAHGGSVLVQITWNDCRKPCTSDYFLYNYSNAVAGAADPARPPALYLLPNYYTVSNYNQSREPDISATGLVCHGHGEAEFVVAALKIAESKDGDAVARAVGTRNPLELHLYRHGEWCVKRPRIIVRGDHGQDEVLVVVVGHWDWEPQAVVPLGDRLLCWVESVDRYRYHGRRGVIFSDVLDESPHLRLVPYPAAAVSYSYRCFLCTNARGALKLVSLSPQRCSHCGYSEHATVVNTWTLKADDMAWVLETEAMVDSDELWTLETGAGVGYARVHLVYPVASMNGGGHRVVPDESSAPTEEEDSAHGRKRQKTQAELDRCGNWQRRKL